MSQLAEPALLHKRGPVPVSGTPAARKYAVVIDAGSSGSRVQVFSWADPTRFHEETGTKNTTLLTSVPEIRQDPEFNLKIKPGISSFAGKTGSLWKKHLSKLVRHAEKGVPKEARHETPVYLLATAGMRLLPAADQQEILSLSCSLLQQKSSFYVPHCASHVSIINGETEALYGWISLNYLLGTFNSYEQPDQVSPASSPKLSLQHPSYGFMDMGGASMQIAFAPNLTESEQHLNDLFHVRLRNMDGKNQEWKVFVSSWLGFGANEAIKRFAQHLLTYNKGIDSASNKLLDPCYPKGTQHSVPIDANTTTQFTGAGDLTECLKTMQPLLRKELPCKDDPCLFNGVHVPAIDFATDHFVGVSEYWYTANDIFKLGGKYDFATFSSHVNAYCGSSWQDILKAKKSGKQYKEVSETALETACFKAAWVINILHSGFGLPFDADNSYGLDSFPALAARSDVEEKSAAFPNLNRRDLEDLVTPFQSASSIEGTELTWMLGRALLYASSQVPPYSSQTPDVGFLPADMSENHYVLGGEIAGVPLPSPKMATTFHLPIGLLFIAGCLFAVVYFFYSKQKRGITWASAKIRMVALPTVANRFINKFRGFPGDAGYQRVLEEGTGFHMDAMPSPPLAASPTAFHVPLAVSAKSTSMLDLNKLHDDNNPVNRVPSRPSSRVGSRINLMTGVRSGDEPAPFLGLPDSGSNLTRSSSRLFHTLGVERLSNPRP